MDPLHGRYDTQLTEAGNVVRVQVLAVLDDRLDRLIDVTLDYPHGVPSFWEFMQGRCAEITMEVTSRQIPDEIRQAADDDARRRATADWVEALWSEKDRKLSRSELALEAAG